MVKSNKYTAGTLFRIPTSRDRLPLPAMLAHSFGRRGEVGKVVGEGGVVVIHKPIGATPLDMVNFFKSSYPQFRNKIISYAGRLDPMAEGVLLLLWGEENKNREKYQNLDKKYKFEVLFGIATDTYDLLGIITNCISCPIPTIKQITGIAQLFVGSSLQEYPSYSSKTVKGKSLYWYARRNLLNTITIPKKRIIIDNISLITTKKITNDKLRDTITSRISRVHGDFRQKEILSRWEEYFSINMTTEYTIAKFEITCSSGTYIRSIANSIGQKLNIPSLAFSITRTYVGSFCKDDIIRLPPSKAKG